MSKVVLNQSGERFTIEGNRLTDNTVFCNNRYVRRSELYKAFRGDVGSVTLFYPAPYENATFSIGARKHGSASSLNIGCKYFRGENADTILAWAMGYKRAKTLAAAKRKRAVKAKAARKARRARR